MESEREKKEIRIHIEITPRNPYPLEDARITIISYLLAFRENARLIGSVQDLEDEFSSESIKSLYSLFRWLGIKFDEGLFNDNEEAGPFKQTQRISIYKDFLLKLLGTEKAFVVPCTQGKNLVAKKNHGTKKKTKSLNAGSALNRLWSGQNDEFEVYLKDLSKADDFVLSAENIKLWNSEGRPTRVFANCVDRHLLRITHVALCEDFEKDCHQERLISEAFGWEPIQYLIFSRIDLADDQIINALKPHPKSIEQMQRLGYLPQVILKYFGRGIEQIRLKKSERIIRAGFQAKLDVDELNRLNQAELQKNDLEKTFELVRPFLEAYQVPLNSKSRIKKILSMLKMHCHSLSQMAEEVNVFLNKKPLHYSAFARSVFRRDSSQKVLWSFLRRAKEVEFMTKDVFLSIMKNVQYETGIMGKELWSPVRIALSGRENSYELALAAEILGKDVCVMRIKAIVGNFW